ncbi:SHOCT domain-containing protein [Aliifodinibius salicampi]|uniref:SHOCT domain-containing protein n=1 Tax=Fodinibius salicampi TaxID=1920655 RepID=A0ABT3PUD9_9BACT|nr:SHOCT domain-containing protein [Fodinibius salicampi]MCW9711459.1 SHOCT domain-containing protein [Fodinibius salicampi]
MFYDHHFIGMHWVWWIIITLIILLTVFNVLPYRYSSSKSSEAPLDILKKRFARGEIEKEEYKERKRIIEENHNP